MNENIFKSEKEIQSWLSDRLNENDCFKELIINAEEIGEANTRTLLETVRLSNIDLQRHVEKGICKKSTMTKYITMEKRLINFLH